MVFSWCRRVLHAPPRFSAPQLLCGIAALVAMFVYMKLSTDISHLRKTYSQLEEMMRTSLQGGYPQSTRQERLMQKQSQTFNEEETVIIYNRVPKTGSTSFVNLAYDLCEPNRFNVIHLNVSKNNHVLSLTDQMRFVQNVTNWSVRKPALYHGHIAYLDFLRFGVGSSPVYINVVREPLDRLISYYYFLRHGDDFRPYVKRRKAGNNESFDECVERGGHDCGTDNLWLQIPFFCGHTAECWSVGSEWALEMAKYNLVDKYLVVGVTEQLQEFVAVLEQTMPRFYTGAVDLFLNGNRSHLRRTSHRSEPSPDTVQKIQSSTVYRMESEFYQFAKEQFEFVKERTINAKATGPRRRKTNFMYEKIRPKYLEHKEDGS